MTVSKTILEKAKEFKKWNEWDTSTSAEFAEFILQEVTAELQKENAEIAKALGIHFCPELEEPWEVPMESEPDYFETLPKAAAFVYALLDKGLSDREKENARLREALEKLPLDSFGDDMAKHDAADFVDNAAAFFDAMVAARTVLGKSGSDKDCICIARGSTVPECEIHGWVFSRAALSKEKE